MGYRKVSYLEQCWYIVKWKLRNRRRKRRLAANRRRNK